MSLYNYKIDLNMVPPMCLPDGLEDIYLIDITCYGDLWRKYLDPVKNKIYDGEYYYEQWQKELREYND